MSISWGGRCCPGAGDPNPHRTFTLEEKAPQAHGAEISVQHRRGRQGGQCEEATFDMTAEQSGDKPADIWGKGMTGRRKCSLKVGGEGLLRVVGRVPWRELWSGASHWGPCGPGSESGICFRGGGNHGGV